MIDFEPTEEQRLLVETVDELTRAKIAPRIRETEEKRALPDDLASELWSLGLSLCSLPESVGGQGLGLLSAVLIEEGLSRGDPSVAYALPGPGSFGRALCELGSEAQIARHLAPYAAGDGKLSGAVAFSERRALRERAGFATTATRYGGGWVLRGEKAYVQNGAQASKLVVFAQVDEAAGWGGIGAFVVDRGAIGLSATARHQTLGLDAVSYADVRLDGVQVDDDARLARCSTRDVARFFVKQALLVAARATGLTQAAYDTARDYCDTRRAFGKPIGHFQAIAFKLADRLIDAESARWLVHRAAWSFDAGRPEDESMRLAAQAAATALEGAMRAADDAVQLHGGAGFIRDYPVEKMMRDAKQMALTCPTPQLLDQLAAALEVGAPLDPALVLPTPETQPIFT